MADGDVSSVGEAASLAGIILEELTDIRRGQLAQLLPLNMAYGFSVIPSTTVPSPTVLLPQADYDVFLSLYQGPEGDMVRSIISEAAQGKPRPAESAAAEAGGSTSSIPDGTPGT